MIFHAQDKHGLQYLHEKLRAFHSMKNVDIKRKRYNTPMNVLYGTGLIQCKSDNRQLTFRFKRIIVEPLIAKLSNQNTSGYRLVTAVDNSALAPRPSPLLFRSWFDMVCFKCLWILLSNWRHGCSQVQGKAFAWFSWVWWHFWHYYLSPTKMLQRKLSLFRWWCTI